MDRGTIEYLRNLAEDVTNEAECWCVIDVAITLDLVEEDVEIILKDYLE